MVSFPIDYTLSVSKTSPAPEWMTGERMSYCEQPDAAKYSVIDEIREFISRLF